MDNTKSRVVSGMRSTGRLHLGHYHGVLANWLKLQQSYQCFFFIADWHALTTHYDESEKITDHVREMVIDWLSVGIDPQLSCIFRQSALAEHAELHLLLSMITPISWLERVPTYKDQLQNLQHKELLTYGFLGYPLLQSADILLYKPDYVPVGEDQASHVEFCREVARKFNHTYGKEDDLQQKITNALKKISKKDAKLYLTACNKFQQEGNVAVLQTAQAIIKNSANLNSTEKEILLGYLQGKHKTILPEPQVLLTEQAKMVGLDGRKMSKSYHNTIGLREEPESVTKKIRTMPTDPARVRRTDAGDPNKCPVWQWHKVYSNEQVKTWVQDGCRGAKIGCLDCKQPVIDAVIQQQQPIIEKANQLQADPQTINQLLEEGQQTAAKLARETLKEIRQVMGLVNG